MGDGDVTTAHVAHALVKQSWAPLCGKTPWRAVGARCSQTDADAINATQNVGEKGGKTSEFLANPHEMGLAGGNGEIRTLDEALHPILP